MVTYAMMPTRAIMQDLQASHTELRQVLGLSADAVPQST